MNNVESSPVWVPEECICVFISNMVSLLLVGFLGFHSKIVCLKKGKLPDFLNKGPSLKMYKTRQTRSMLTYMYTRKKSRFALKVLRTRN